MHDHKSKQESTPAPSSPTDSRVLKDSSLKRSLAERFFHALVFEIVAILLTAAAIVWVMGKPLSHAGALAIAISTIAMLWNMLFNAAFDRAQIRIGFDRTVVARILHALLFELGLTIAIVPLAAWALGIGLLDALILDFGVLLFFLVYSFAYNWGYDILRARLIARNHSPALNTP